MHVIKENNNSLVYIIQCALYIPRLFLHNERLPAPINSTHTFGPCTFFGLLLSKGIHLESCRSYLTHPGW